LYGANDLFLGPCIRQAGELEQVATQSILKDLRWKKLIFASMGSQTKEYVKKSTLFFEFIIGAMRHEALKEYHLLLSLGSTTNGNDFGMVPDNVSVLSWVSQVELLKHVSLAVVHGGLGSIKECIYFRIPMIIFPMGRDQMDNGVRAQKKQVGLVENIENVTIEKFVSHVESILNRDSLKEGISRMSAIFHDSENQQRDVVFIDNIFRK
jgi:MGT family glycosyltransferase